jgi:hypothetical protein
MGQHRPEPAQSDRTDVYSELRQIPFQKRLDESPAPLVAFSVSAGQKSPRESSSNPESLAVHEADFVKGESLQFMEIYATGKRFRSLAEEFRRRAPQDQETGGPSHPVGEDTKDPEKPREPLDLVDDDKSFERLEREQGIGKTSKVFRIFQVEIGRRFRQSSHDGSGKGCLPNLAGADDADDGIPFEESAKSLDFLAALDHRLILC